MFSTAALDSFRFVVVGLEWGEAFKIGQRGRHNLTPVMLSVLFWCHKRLVAQAMDHLAVFNDAHRSTAIEVGIRIPHGEPLVRMGLQRPGSERGQFAMMETSAM